MGLNFKEREGRENLCLLPEPSSWALGLGLQLADGALWDFSASVTARANSSLEICLYIRSHILRYPMVLFLWGTPTNTSSQVLLLAPSFLLLSPTPAVGQEGQESRWGQVG